MESYDLVLHKEIVKRVRELKYTITDNPMLHKTPVVVIGESLELEDNTKTFDRNQIEYTLNVWGSENGSNLEIKQIKANLITKLTQPYIIKGYKIDEAKITNTMVYREMDSDLGTGSNTYFYRCIITISYLIKEES